MTEKTIRPRPEMTEVNAPTSLRETHLQKLYRASRHRTDTKVTVQKCYCKVRCTCDMP